MERSRRVGFRKPSIFKDLILRISRSTTLRVLKQRKSLILIALLGVMIVITVIALKALYTPRPITFGSIEEKLRYVCKNPRLSLVVVVTNGTMKISDDDIKRIDKAFENFVKTYYFNRYHTIPVVPNYTICSISADELNLTGLRFYPQLVVVVADDVIGDAVKAIYDKVLEDNVYLLNRYATYDIMKKANISLTFKYSASAILVNGTTKFSSIPENKIAKVKEIAERLALVEITNFSVVEWSRYPNLTIYPTIVYISKDPIDQDNELLEKLRDNVYVFKKSLRLDLVDFMSRYLDIELIAETHTKPNTTYVPIYGSKNATLYLYIYEDLLCPWCSRFHTFVVPDLEKYYIFNNTLALIHKNLIVHSEIRKFHEHSMCLALKYENLTLIIEIFHAFYDVYTAYLENGSGYKVIQNVDQYYRKAVEEILGHYEDCNISSLLSIANDVISRDNNEASNVYGITGTPGFVLWSNEKNIGFVFVGYRDFDYMKKLIEYLLEL